MHRALAAWLTARPWRAAFASALCGALSAISPLPYASPLPFVMLSGAISVLVLLRFDTTSAFGVAFSGAMAASLIVLTQTHASIWLFAAVLWIFFAPVALAALLKRTQSMNLCVQTAVLATAGCVLLIYAVLEDPAEFWIPLVTRAVDATSESLFYLPDERELIVKIWAQTMWGALAAYSVALVLGALFLGRWWESLLRAPGEFGLEYRRLRLGVVLGTCITVLFALLVLNRTSPRRITCVGRVARARFSGFGGGASEQGARLSESRLACGDLRVADRAVVEFGDNLRARAVGLRRQLAQTQGARRLIWLCVYEGAVPGLANEYTRSCARWERPIDGSFDSLKGALWN